MLEILKEVPQSLPLEVLQQVLEQFLSERGVTQTVTLVFCDDEAIAALNGAHRGVEGPTDVLSYPLEEPGDATIPSVEQLGDIFISVDTATKQAKEHGLTLPEELLTLAAHGITHLCGFDHPTEEAWQTFHKAQKRVLELYHVRP